MDMFDAINSTLFWFILGIIFLVLEVTTPGFFLIFFGFGAWVVSILVWLLPLSPGLQWVVFMAISIAALVTFRRRLKVFFEGRLGKKEKASDPVFDNQFLGRDVLVLGETTPNSGLVELNGTNWQARTLEGVLPLGSRAVVTKIDGLTLIVAGKTTSNDG
ncbi:MAG: NfeD family protein [Candidatus Adiutrix sp.]